MIWSPFQKKIFTSVTNGPAHHMVNAVAGSGKSTTLVEAVQKMKGKKRLFVAFNKHVADALRPKLPEDVQVSTLHALGLKRVREALGPTTVNDDKYTDLTKTWMDRNKPKWKDDWEWVEIFKAISDLVKFRRLVADTKRALDRYSVDSSHTPWEASTEILAQGLRLAKDSKVIDFTDMLWLPMIEQMQGDKFNIVATDEVQDLSPAARHLLLRSIRSDGRSLCVGDPSQSVMLFAGADPSSFEMTKGALSAEELPLSISYRCPVSHITLAQALVPHIQAREGAPEGQVLTIDQEELLHSVSSNDLIICRTTAPVVDFALKCIRSGKFARVRGRDIGGVIASFCRAAQRKYGWDSPEISLRDWADELHAKAYRRKAKETVHDGINDRLNTALACVDGIGDADGFEGFLGGIQKLFTDTDQRGAIWCSTVHRAKGLEAERVAILQPVALEPREGLSDDERQQSLNVKYVALTRAKETLWLSD